MEQVQSLVRKALTLLAGWLAAKGLPFIDSAVADWLSAGVVLGITTYLSWRNAKQKTVLKEAVSGEISVNAPEVKAIVPHPDPVAAPEPSPVVR